MKKYEIPTVQIQKFDVETNVMLNVSSTNTDPGWGGLID